MEELMWVSVPSHPYPNIFQGKEKNNLKFKNKERRKV
jgi:hypothetical protein